jgi:hypothetical protein
MKKYSLIALSLTHVIILVSLARSLVADTVSPSPALNRSTNVFLDTTEQQIKNDNQAYYFFLGMCRDSQRDPTHSGRRILEYFNNFDRRENLPCSPKSNSFLKSFRCDMADHECYQNVLRNPQRFFSQIERHKHYLLQYNKFLSFRRFATTTKPKLEAPKGAFDWLSKGNILRTLDILRYAQHHDAAEAAQALRSDIGKLRSLLQQADTIRFKNHIALLLNHNLMALTQLHEDYNLSNNNRISHITPAEANLDLAIARDFAEHFHSIYNRDLPSLLKLLNDFNNTEIKEFMDNKLNPKDVTNIYDRTMTINDIATLYEQLRSASPLSPDWHYDLNEAINDLKNHYSKKYVQNKKLAYNTMGFGIIRSTIDSFHMPFLRAHQAIVDLNQRINTLNKLISGRPAGN